MARQGVWPPPVYVARFRAGETIRMSCWSPQGEPWRFDAARRMVQQVIGNERVITEMRKAGEWRYWRTAGNPPATDIISGHIEHQGKIYPDPWFGSLLHRMEPSYERTSSHLPAQRDDRHSPAAQHSTVVRFPTERSRR